ncbi:MAG TPA: sigma-70 family RNA polymerase sigma factor [Thermoanaerobaculia bacterium]|nr:sigma-70 family RNA polymerase sigma factor [Thermoanaerobaculia bacterium]
MSSWQTSACEERAFALAEADFADVVREHERMVFSIARNMVGDPAAAEELAQEAFLELFRHRDEIESKSHLLFWLRRVTTNRCIDAIRRRRPMLAIDEVPELSEPARYRDPLMSRALRSGMQELPSGQRAVITLRYQEELGLSEIAEALALPLPTVKSHLRRGLARLRTQLETLSRRSP